MVKIASYLVGRTQSINPIKIFNIFPVMPNKLGLQDRGFARDRRQSFAFASFASLCYFTQPLDSHKISF